MGHANEQYFSAQPSSNDIRTKMTISIRDNEYEVTVSNSVFSTHRLDLGTKVLLDRVPSPLSTQELTSHTTDEIPADADTNTSPMNLLDLGCGWGPVTIALSKESPSTSIVWALDVNERAIELTNLNARNNHCENVRAGTVESLSEEYREEWTQTQFDVIWSNPPIRVGKEVLHNLLLTYLPRLRTNGTAYMVVQKNLGADSLMTWLEKNLNSENVIGQYHVSKFASAKGYRIIEVNREG